MLAVYSVLNVNHRLPRPRYLDFADSLENLSAHHGGLHCHLGCGEVVLSEHLDVTARACDFAEVSNQPSRAGYQEQGYADLRSLLPTRPADGAEPDAGGDSDYRGEQECQSLVGDYQPEALNRELLQSH
ncbi:uncharacterized protein METZ01_LOCUS279635 [marine metagenome]|uniref:Uncharacterized protein n=1 Tax=marine metagenome TaxID=408172 RepID=A0A382KVW0_9ZZZZ